MNDSNPNRPHGKMPSDVQMDDLLYRFFRLEVPVELNRPFGRSSTAVSSGPTLAVVPVQTELTHPVQRNRRLVVVSAIAVLALTVLVAIRTPDSRSSTSTPIANTIEQQHSPVSPPEDLMPVSSQGNAKSAQNVVGEDGVTLEETDNIEVKPHR